MSRIPLGEREGSRLEFKSAEALKDPEKIAREVVAMLNADGGEVWVGLREETGRAVAVEPVARPEEAIRRLWDFLVDTIEPRILDREIRIESADEGEGVVLRIEVVSDSSRKPFAWLRKGGRYFDVRVGDRIRPMTREEILLGQSRSEPAESQILEEREARREKGGQYFWVGLEPVSKLEMDVAGFRSHLVDPTLSGGRRTGQNFTFSLAPPVPSPKGLRTDQIEVRRDGTLLFEVPLESLSLGRRGKERELWPVALLEFPVSAFRLAKVVYDGQLASSDLVLADFALVGIRDWILRGGTPVYPPTLNEPHTFKQGADLFIEAPLRFSFEEIRTNPDACAYRVIRKIYEAFDFSEAEIPEWFDRKTYRLIFPE